MTSTDQRRAEPASRSVKPDISSAMRANAKIAKALARARRAEVLARKSKSIGAAMQKGHVALPDDAGAPPSAFASWAYDAERSKADGMPPSAFQFWAYRK